MRCAGVPLSALGVGSRRHYPRSAEHHLLGAHVLCRHGPLLVLFHGAVTSSAGTADRSCWNPAFGDQVASRTLASGVREPADEVGLDSCRVRALGVRQRRGVRPRRPTAGSTGRPNAGHDRQSLTRRCSQSSLRCALPHCRSRRPRRRSPEPSRAALRRPTDRASRAGRVRRQELGRLLGATEHRVHPSS